MEWSHQTVLVTGAGGFIGSHLTERLVALGARARALVRYTSSGTWGWLDRSPVKEDIQVLVGDVRDADGLRDAMRGVEVVFHLAALIGIPYSYHTPLAYVRTNVEGTLNVLQAAQDAGVKLVVHTSTSEVYGTARYSPIDEAHPLQAQSPYAASKIAAEKLAEAFSCSYGMPVVVLRPFNTFGPRQSARAIVPTIITQCLTGETVRLGNTASTRDLNYVGDVVEGFIRAAATPQAIGRTVNLGSGRQITIENLAQMIAKLLDRPLAIHQDAQRLRPASSEVERLVADPTVARTVLGWEPSTSLEDGLTHTIEWIKDHLDGYRPHAYHI
ncbi:MAG: GDP-mannose 4,6-dehydratase [Candidatus Omnitrophica bacterium]|nr:GDP-mannose 4,6-dehydratase [Candidatus Omnitrophota bacterium]